MAEDLEQEIDRLYRLPLGEFTAARNELAKRLRQAKEREAADRVKKLAKPTLTAWAVNQLHHEAADEMEAFVEASAALRQAYLAGAEERREAQAERRRAQAELLDRAEEVLRDAGTEPGRDHRQRMARTLEALAAGGDDLPPPGRLTRDLEPPGFDALGDFASMLEKAVAERRRSGSATRPKAPKKTKKGKKEKEPEPELEKKPAEVVDFAARRRRTLERKLAQAEEALAEHEERLAERRRQEGAERKELEAAEKSAAEAAAAAEEAERRAHEARERAEKARAGLAGPRRRAEAAAAAVRRSETEVEKAREKVEELTAQQAELEES